MYFYINIFKYSRDSRVLKQILVLCFDFKSQAPAARPPPALTAAAAAKRSMKRSSAWRLWEFGEPKSVVLAEDVD